MLGSGKLPEEMRDAIKWEAPAPPPGKKASGERAKTLFPHFYGGGIPGSALDAAKLLPLADGEHVFPF